MLLFGFSKAAVLVLSITTDGTPIVGLLLGAAASSLAFLMIGRSANMGILELIRLLGMLSKP